MRRRLLPYLLLFVATVLALPAQAASQDEPLQGFERFVEAMMARWHVPGLAVAVVKDDRVLLTKGFGFRDPGRGLPVTPDTLFALGSVTKSFTATGLAMLVDDGQLEWDRPVRSYMPDFGMQDPDAAALISARDLLTHRSGLPRHDVIWYLGAFDRAELMARLRYLRPTKDLGEAFQYQNLMYMAAGYLAGRRSGRTWENFTEFRLLEPLGMTATRLSLLEFLAAREIALPHFPYPGGFESVALRDTDAIGPASAVYSNARDMARYLRFHLGDGRFEGRRLLSPEAVSEMQRPQVPLNRRSNRGKLVTHGYGLGFYTARYHGRRMIRHGGAIDGYLAEFSFMPDDGIGVVVLSNLSGHNPVPRLVALEAYNRLLGLAPRRDPRRINLAALLARAKRPDFAAVLENAKDIQPVPKPKRLQLAAYDPIPAPPVVRPSRAPRPLAAYAGRYRHPAYGEIAIRPGLGGLEGRLQQIAFTLIHHQGDVWRVPETIWPLREGLDVTFLTDAAGKIDRLVTPLADGPSYRFNPGEMIFTRR